ncbi:MAG: hypothetical protein PHC41_14830 [Lachnospiraceae bacterium]|nr:hypothetical protein [Anaerostipes sp.]MDD3617480.1 hypothetical protein [Lachnospiraceae bacterium]
MYYDITTPDMAYDWIYDTLQIKQGRFIEDFILKCNKDIDSFCEMYKKQIQKINIEKLEIVAFHVTSNKDRCVSIRKNGIRNLQWVLSNETEMRYLLAENGILFYIDQQKMCANSQEYDIGYAKYKGKNHATDTAENLEWIAHKIYYDYQINAFFFCEDISKYSTVCKMPEFLYTLSNLSDDAQKVADQWIEDRKPYVIKYKANFKDFAYYTFYDNEMDYQYDEINNYKFLKKILILRAIDGMNGELADDVFAYMKPETYIPPEDILEITSAEEWRINVLKYFGKA